MDLVNRETFRFVYAVSPENLDTASCRLFISVDDSFMNLCIYDTGSDKILVFKQLRVEENPAGIISTEPLLQQQYKSVSYLYHAPDFDIKPEGFASPDKYQNTIRQAACVNQWTMDDKIYKLLAGAYPQIHAREYHSVLLELVACKQFADKGPVLFLSGNKGRSHIMLLSKGRLLFANSFDTWSPEEVLYYCLKVLKESGIQQEDAVLYFTSDIHNQENTTALLKQYFLRAEPFTAAYSHYNGLFDETDIATYFPLLNLDICA